MIRTRRVALTCLAVVLTTCAVPDDTRTPAPVFGDDARRAVYERTDLDFETGILYKPVEGTVKGDAWTLAPLLIQEVPGQRAGGAGRSSGPATVYYAQSSVRIGGREYPQWSYLWPYPGEESAQGIRMTIGDDGFPAIYEVLRDSSGLRLLFVADTLEESAAEALASRLPGRRFTIEPSVEQAPDVVVGGTLESGPTPLGPFVYVWEQDRNVNTVICRCMPSRVVSIPTTATYDLEPLDPGAAPPEVRHLLSAARSTVAERALRLTNETIQGSGNVSRDDAESLVPSNR